MTLRRKASLGSSVAHRGANGMMGEVMRKAWCRREIYTKAIDVSSRSDGGSQVGAEFNADEPLYTSYVVQNEQSYYRKRTVQQRRV